MPRKNAAVRKLIPPITRHVALRLRAARKAAGLSQEAAAGELGLTFQQLQKYERARNRIGTGELLILARRYGKPIDWFFDGAPGGGEIIAAEPNRDVAVELLAAPYGYELARDYLAIAHNATRRVVADVAHAFANADARQRLSVVKLLDAAE